MTPSTTSTDARTPSDLARETFRVLFEERDLSDPYRFWTDATVDHFVAAGISVRGAHALTEWFRDLFAAVPDWHVDIENTFDDGDRQVVVQWRGGGTFTGAPFLGIEPTGRTVDLKAVDVFRFDENGKVETNTVYYDGAEFARQVGMLPPRDSAVDRGMLAAFNAGTRLKRRLQQR
jgi:steroid delta-isomerase-like uncharacterized protein